MTMFFRVTFTYNCGMLGSEKKFDDYKGAVEFLDDYIRNFPDSRKSAIVEKIEITKRFFRTEQKTTTIMTWDE